MGIDRMKIGFLATASLRHFSMAALILATSAMAARAELRIDITRGVIDPMPVAVTDFYSTDTRTAAIGRELTEVIAADLERSGLFAPIDQRAFIQSNESLLVRPRFSDWRVINSQALVSGSVSYEQDGRLKFEFRLWDVFAETQMTGFAYRTPRNNWRRVAHIIADAIYKRITGEEGYFDSRIVYVAETGPHTMRIKRLAIMDQDGANHKYLTDGSALVLTPRFSPTRQEITYLSYFNDTPRVYLFDINTGRQEMLGAFKGMTFAPRFSPDGNSVIMSYSKDGVADIWIMDLRTRRARQVTSDPAIDTSPSFSPDGRQITFNSDRGGTQQLYVMDADGRNVRRISFGQGRYATPVWSPRGDLIAFTKFYGGRFFTGVMRPDGTGERLLTESFLDEAPTWSPNGRVLIFFRQTRTTSSGSGGVTKIYSVDLTSYNLRQVKTPTDASDPAWSPLNR
jgi:TolB protein